MNQLLEEINQTIALLEATIPANPRSPKGERQADRLEAEIRKYFRALEQAMPLDKVEELYYRLVEP